MTKERDEAQMTKLTAQAAGTFAIAPTPFHDDGRIDEKSIDRLTDFYAEVGCDGVTVLGILGEAPKLEGSEAEAVAKRFINRAGKMQVIVGISAPGFASMRSLARAWSDAGAAGVMTGYAFPELLIDVVRLSKEGRRDAAHDLFDAHLPLIRYEQQPGAGLAVRKYVLQKRGVIASSAQRKAGSSITAIAKAEIDYLLARVARIDKRANLQPQSSAAG